MVSRRKILSRSKDDLNLDHTFSPQEEEEDVWYQKEKLFKEHIQEVLDKWTQIDDEIWAKVIVFERNRRVAKAYARAPVLTINGSDDGFDGMRIGLCGFDNPMRDQKTEEYKRHIGQGVKIKMDDAGNILIRRYAKSNVYIKSTASNPNEETSIGADILKLPNQALESEKIVKLFDMKKFQSNVNRELRRAYPDRRRLETQCLSVVAFVRSENDILECPVWVLIVNVVAMDMLKSKLPPVQRPMVDIKNRPKIPIPDEDPYSVAGNGSGGSSGSSGFGAGSSSGHQQQSIAGMGGVALHGMNGVGTNNGGSVLGGGGHVAATREQLLLQSQQMTHKRSEKPPKLPPRDNIYAHDIIPKPDYDDIEVDTRIKLARGKSDKGKDNKKYDDPYYCGLRARVPNFVKSSKSSKDHKDHATNGGLIANGSISNSNGNTNMNTLSQKKTSMIHMSMTAPNLQHAMHVAPQPPPHMHPHHIQQQQLMAAAAAHAVHHHHPAASQQHHPMWQTRSYESGIGIYSSSSDIGGNQGGCQQQQQQQMNATATANFLMDHALQTNSNNNGKNKNHQMIQAHDATTTKTLQAHAQSQVQLHAQQQQQQQMHNTLTPLSCAALPQRIPADAPYNNDGHEHLTYNNNNKHNIRTQQQQQEQRQQHLQNFQQAHQRHHHHHHHNHERHTNRHHHRHHNRHCGARRHLSFNMHDNYELLPASPNYNNKYNPYDLAETDLGLNDMRAQSPLLTGRASRSPRRHFNRQLQQTLSPHRLQTTTAHMQRDGSSAVGGDCNCVSCYTLAPLFGVAQPTRPPRSLSQQQLRLHQKLSGSLADIPPPPPPPPPLPSARMHAASGVGNVGCSAARSVTNAADIGGYARRSPVAVGARAARLTKWCSENDLSLLNKRRMRCLATSDCYTYDEGFSEVEGEDFYDVGGNAPHNDDEYLYMSRESDGAPLYANDFDLGNDDYAARYDTRRPQTRMTNNSSNMKSYNAHALQTRHCASNYTYKDDMELDAPQFNRHTSRLRQFRSPTPPQPPLQKCTNSASFSSSPARLRQKSLSNESFFEQPNEEGSLYMYGGRKRITRTPSTTNLYDRLKSKSTTKIPTTMDFKKVRATNENEKSDEAVKEKARRQQVEDRELLNFQRQKLGLRVSKNSKTTAEPPTKTTTKTTTKVEEKPVLPPPRWRGRKNLDEKTKAQAAKNVQKASAGEHAITAAKSTKTTTTESARLVTAAAKQLNGSKVAATKAAFEMKMQNEKRLEQQTKLNQKAELQQIQNQQQKQQLKSAILAANASKHEAKANEANQIKTKTGTLDNNNNNNQSKNNNNNKGENKDFKFNNNRRDNNSNNNVIKNTNYETPQQQQHSRQERLSRPASRLDASDMESIYGYLKPRKPRSLSLKKIQIMDY